MPEPEHCDATTWYADSDGDGFGSADPVSSCTALSGWVDNADDCDDADPAVHPGATEDCAVAVDANCDGSIGYADADADGVAACDDCDDSDATVSPFAAEFCNDRDDDCDGSVDEDPADGRYWYVDADGDGHGVATDSVRACETPDGYAETFTDCDDTNAAVSPDATETCDGIDDDCDGSVDEADAAAGYWYPDDDADGWGAESEGELTCTPAAGWVSVRGDCDDENGAISPGAEEFCDGMDDDCDGDVDEDDAVDAQAWYLDEDLDGYGDPSTARMSCDTPVTYIATGGDCDDLDPSISPAALEICDLFDNDCDGVTDEPTADDASLWYADTDMDGYAGRDAPVLACFAPTGSYASAEDCDDTDPGISPGALERCDGIDDDCDGATDEDAAIDAVAWYTDADGDGWGDLATAHAACTANPGEVASAGDCDDADATISPGAPERCNGVDDDCDTLADESAVDAGTWYADLDLDGWGDDATGAAACDAPEGSVAHGGDCDDADDAVHPSAAESCDGIDANCDGFVGSTDEDGDGYVSCDDCDDGRAEMYPGAIETCDGRDEDCDGEVDGGAGDAWYVDADGDGFGDPGNTIVACEAPAGASSDATDCDDADAAISPGAAESCATAADDDCDGSENDLDALECTAFYLDFDGDTSGSTTSLCLCEGISPFTAAASDDCDDGDATVAPVLPEVWGNGVDDDCDTEVDIVVLSGASAVLAGDASSDAAGRAIAGPGDVDGDGLADVLVGAANNDDNGSNAGAAYVVFGGTTGQLALDEAPIVLAGETAGDGAGISVAGADLDGDGLSELVIGAQERDSGTGAVYVLSSTWDLASADGILTGERSGDEAGGDVACVGDTDGDGKGDVLIGGDGNDTGGSAAGIAWLVRDPLGGTLSADASFVGEDAGDAAGRSVAGGHDVDGDGLMDVFVGAPGDDDGAADAGAAYLLLGPVLGTTDLATNDGKYTGAYANDEFGTVVELTDDIDGDGLDDMLVGTTSFGLGGGAWLFRGPGAAILHPMREAVTSWQGTSLSDNVGVAVAGIGDVDGDGHNDIAVSGSGRDDYATNAGAVYVFLAPAGGGLALTDAEATFYGTNSQDAAGVSVVGLGDTDGDGVPDVGVGASGSDLGGSSSGAAYVMVGPG